MKIKKFIANNMPEAMKKIRTELGSDAVILNSKPIKSGGFLGLFKKNKIEVIAALDPEPFRTPKIEQPAQPMRKVPSEPLLTEKSNKEETTRLLQEVHSIKKMLHQQQEGTNQFPPNYQIVYQHLIDQEMDQHISQTIIHSVQEQLKDDEALLTNIIDQTKLEIENRLTAVKRNQPLINEKVVHFIGPTGVGKTTTLAKIAANRVLKEKRKVAFITLDTYRIAAIDQLKTYARILNVPIEVAYSPKDYEQAIHKFSDYDDIFVDTAGRNYRNEKYVQELLDHMQGGVKTYIVLALTAKPKDILEIYNQFKHVPDKEVIFTKLDETTQYGSIVNIALTHNVNIAYLTNGQDVPEDLVLFDPKALSDDIVGGCLDE